jgi:hypothetical protein
MRATPLFWSLLHVGHAHLELALAKLTWSLCWPCSSGTCAGLILLPFVVWGFSPDCTGAVRLSGCDVLIKLYDLYCLS